MTSIFSQPKGYNVLFLFLWWKFIYDPASFNLGVQIGWGRPYKHFSGAIGAEEIAKHHLFIIVKLGPFTFSVGNRSCHRV